MFLTKQDFIKTISLHQTWLACEHRRIEEGKEFPIQEFFRALNNRDLLSLLDFYQNLTYRFSTYLAYFNKNVSDPKFDLVKLRDDIKNIILDIFGCKDLLSSIEKTVKNANNTKEETPVSIEDLTVQLKIKLDDKIPFLNASSLHFTGNPYIDENILFPVEYIQRLDEHFVQGMNSELAKYIRSRKKKLTEVNQKYSSIVNKARQEYQDSITREILSLYPPTLVALSKIYHSFMYKTEDILREKGLMKKHVFESDEDWMKFQTTLKKRCASLGIDQNNLSKLSRLTKKKTIHRYLHGKRMKSTLTVSIFKLSCALKCSSDYLLGKSDFESIYFDPSGTEWTIPFTRFSPLESAFIEQSKIGRPCLTNTLDYILKNQTKLSDDDFKKIKSYVAKLSKEKIKIDTCINTKK